MKITIEIDEEDLARLMEKSRQQGEHWRLTPSYTRDITPTYEPTWYMVKPETLRFYQKYPCEVTSPWDRFDSFNPQDFPMTID